MFGGSAMAIEAIDVKGYRSIRDVHLQLGRINVLVGPNACGKSNLYNSMYLLHAAANGQFARAIASEGGMGSALWAGGDEEAMISYRTKSPVRMNLGVTVDSTCYNLSCGLPVEGEAFNPFDIDPRVLALRGVHKYDPFILDPRIKEETVYFLSGKKRSQLLDRNKSSVWLRDLNGDKSSFTHVLSPSESVISQLREPHRFPQLSMLREHFLSWRFYHQFRTDVSSPIREPRAGTLTPVISHDGNDLAAALLTVQCMGDWEALNRSIDRGLAGAYLEIVDNVRGYFELMLRTPGVYRPLSGRELSDGTLRYLCLLSALLSPHPPKLLALNEPETSLHPDLLEPLADLIVHASYKSQMWITTHSTALAGFIEEHSGVPPINLKKVDGATKIVGDMFRDVD
jgi:predicted ATPase